jgi:hypothetical protein
VVGGPVVADQPRAVHGEDHVQLLQADVVDQLVEGALQEGRVDRADGLGALQGEPGGEEDRVLLGDADVVVLLGERLAELVEAGAPRHRGGDSDHPRILLCLRDQGVGEDGGVLRRRGRRRLLELLDLLRRVRLADGDGLRLLLGRRAAVDDRARLGGVPLLHPLQAALLGRLEALALDGVDVDDHRPVGLQRLRKRTAQGGHVVAVDHAHVGEVELLEEEPRRPVGLHRGLHLGSEPLDPAAQAERQVGEPLLGAGAGLVQARVEPDPLEVAGDRPDVRRDRHAVVVEHDHDRRLQPARVVERLIGDPAGEGAVADHGDDLAVLADALAHRLLQAHGVADRGGGVAGAHDVVLGLEDRAEGGEPLVLADRVEAILATGEHLVRVGLMTDVPEDLVPGRVEQAVKGHGQLTGT